MRRKHQGTVSDMQVLEHKLDNGRDKNTTKQSNVPGQKANMVNSLHMYKKQVS